MNKELLISNSNIKNKIHTIRGVQVMLDSDLANLYDVKTKQLNRAVKRNIERFPNNFMFQLSESEHKNLKSQFTTSSRESLKPQTVTLNKSSLRFQNDTLERTANLKFQNDTSSSNKGNRGKHRKYLPYVFTEQGVSMLSGVLRSKTAIKVSIQIINAFVTMRRFISKNAEIFQRLDNVERKNIIYDKKFEKVFDAIENKITISTLTIIKQPAHPGQKTDWESLTGIWRDKQK